MLRLLIFFMSPRSTRRAIFNLVVLLVPLNLLAIVVQFLVLGADAIPLQDLILLTSIVGTPFMLGGQFIGARQVATKDRLVEMATTDMLTRLPNRRAFMERARSALSLNKGVMLLLDADHFKDINDNYGHAAGDHCLQVMADHLQGLLRSDDVIGRVGGEEFAIFLPKATMETARQIGQRISMGLLVETGSGSSLHFTVSVGAASVGPHMTLDEALRDADIALYRAKTAGRARMEIAA